MIPKIIHQTIGPCVAPGIDKCLESVRRHHSDWEVRVYSNREMYESLGLEEDSIIGVEAADLFRLKLLRDYGGWYLDADMYCIGTLPSAAQHYLCYEEQGWMPHPVICNWAMASEAGNEFVARCYAEGWHRLRETNRNVIYRTGPGMMAEIYEMSDWGFTPHPHYLVGSRALDRIDRQRFIPAEAKAIHLFLGCWYKHKWVSGLLHKVRVIQDYEKTYRSSD